MTLTVVVGSSGSGKTTFLNDTTNSHKCTYIRQFHNIRPYITVSKIPNFDPKGLPYWHIYEREGKDKTIKVGGTMAGEFPAGLSGGQRKLLLFELIYQRTVKQNNLLLLLDEPFMGVTDDFVPWIIQRLNLMGMKHNILLVTNDHVEELSAMADNTTIVSAIDRTSVQVNSRMNVPREKCIAALSAIVVVAGDDEDQQKTVQKYNNSYTTGSCADVKFFLDVEIINNSAFFGVVLFTLIANVVFLITFWGSSTMNGVTIIVAAGLVSFFCVYPYLLSLIDWRNVISEEAEALLHASKATNKTMKGLLTLTIIFLISLVAWGVMNAVVDGFEDIYFWAAVFLDNASYMVPGIYFGLCTEFQLQTVQIVSALPAIFMIYFSTTFSPGSGFEVFKGLRYLFPRFYLFCKIPGVMDVIEGCPNDDLNLLYLTLSALLGSVVCGVYEIVQCMIRSNHTKKHLCLQNKIKNDNEYREIQMELFGQQEHKIYSV